MVLTPSHTPPPGLVPRTQLHYYEGGGVQDILKSWSQLFRTPGIRRAGGAQDSSLALEIG